MDCCYSNRDGSPTLDKELPNISSPEMFNSDNEDDNKVNEPKRNKVSLVVSPEKPSQAELVTKSDNKLLVKINKLLSGVPPPPKLTINRTDCSELLLRIYENQDLFWTPHVLPDKQVQQNISGESLEQQKENISTNNCPRAKSAPRNLSTAFDACDPQYENNISNNLDTIDIKSNACSDNFRIEKVVPSNESCIVNASASGIKISGPEQVQKAAPTNKVKQVSFAPIHRESLHYYTIDEKTVPTLVWPEAYLHTFHGIQ